MAGWPIPVWSRKNGTGAFKNKKGALADSRRRRQGTGWRDPSFRMSGFFGEGSKRRRGRGVREGRFPVGLLGGWFRPEAEHVGLDHPERPGASFEGRDNLYPVFEGTRDISQPIDGQTPNGEAVTDGYFGGGNGFGRARHDKGSGGTEIRQPVPGQNSDEMPGRFGAEGMAGCVCRNSVHEKFCRSGGRDLLDVNNDAGKRFPGFSGNPVTFLFAAACSEGLDRKKRADTDKETGGKNISDDFSKNWHFCHPAAGWYVSVFFSFFSLTSSNSCAFMIYPCLRKS